MTSTTFTIPTLETERLILRAHREEDIAAEKDFFASDASRLSAAPCRHIAHGAPWR